MLNRELQRSYIVMTTMVLIGVIVVVTTVIVSFAALLERQVVRVYGEKQALYLAEAGVDRAIRKFNADLTYVGETFQLPPGEAEVALTAEGNDRLVTSTGFVPTRAAPRVSKRIRVRLSPSTTFQEISFQQAVFTGDDGILLDNSAKILGDAKSRGNIVCNNDAVIRNQDDTGPGQATSPGTITPACTSDRVTANPGDLPSFNYQFWRDEANRNNDPIDAASLSCNPSCTLGPRRVVGDFTLNHDQVIILSGTVHFTGKLTLQNDARVRLDQPLIDARTGAVLIVDSEMVTQNDATIEVAAGPSFILVGAPATGIAIRIQNSANDAENGPVMYATNGQVEISNSANGVAVIARGLHVKNSATVRFRTPVGQPSGGRYTVTGYRYSIGSYQELNQ